MENRNCDSCGKIVQEPHEVFGVPMFLCEKCANTIRAELAKAEAAIMERELEEADV